MVIVVYVAVMIVCVLYIKKRRRRRILRGNDSSDLTGLEGDRIKMAAKDRELQPEEQLPMLTKATVLCTNPAECPDMCELHEMKPCTICSNCSTYVSAQGLALGRDEGHYGRPAAVITTNGNGLKLSPSKEHFQNLPHTVRVQAGQASPAPAVTYQVRDRIVRPLAVDEQRLYSESPYGFPTAYFKSFVKPVASPVAPEIAPDSVTSPDIVPEYCGQNSANAAIARSVAGQQRQAAGSAAPEGNT